MRPINVGLGSLARERERLLRRLTKLVGNRDTAEDILQTAYLKAIVKQKTLRSAASLTPWFYRVLQNATIDDYRRRRSEKLALAALFPVLHGRGESDSRARTCRCVIIGLANLTDDYRQALWSLEVKGMRADAFARRAGITANNARVRAHRARRSLYRELRKICGPCADRHCVDCTCPRVERRARRPARSGGL